MEFINQNNCVIKNYKSIILKQTIMQYLENKIQNNEIYKNFQSCSDLKLNHQQLNYPNWYIDIYNLQESIQTNVYKYDFDDIRNSISKQKNFAIWNCSAIHDEFRELLNSFGGEYQSAFWKPWKSKHKELIDQNVNTFAELPLKWKLETYFEIIDIFHFLNNLLLISKNQEDIKNKIFDLSNKTNDSNYSNISYKLQNNNSYLLQSFYDEYFNIISDLTEYLINFIDSNIIFGILSKLLKFAFKLGINNQLFIDLYFAKNQENINRQKTGY